MQAMEDGIGMLEALSDFLAENRVSVRIGSENRRADLDNVSIVATHYGVSAADGVVGVIGPTRMDYPKVITAVRAVADGLNEALR
jgi:heat-inducible transcriptional repressor